MKKPEVENLVALSLSNMVEKREFSRGKKIVNTAICFQSFVENLCERGGPCAFGTFNLKK
jgi:hypothetical protein